MGDTESCTGCVSFHSGYGDTVYRLALPERKGFLRLCTMVVCNGGPDRGNRREEARP
jgi:hypothetical protein